ncbi:FadR family transcriptional regulator [Candidatus Gracilibacteria bacterium]|nr:FadR family transcriptional regulator [Candidatus Gracilibacteria bacterium]
MAKNDEGLPERVSQQLLRRIISKEFPPGAVLPSEREIGETYAVSRPVAREAIKLLAARGIVAVHPRQGATVGQNLIGAAGEALLLAFHQADVVREDMLDMRMVLEPHIAALAAQHASPTQLRRLSYLRQLILSLLQELDTANSELMHNLWQQTDQPLHVLLGEMSQNLVFKIFVEIINTILWPQRQEQIPPMTEEHFRQASLQHLALCDAVLANDSAGASAAMVRHLEYTRDHILSVHQRLYEPIQVFID